jgi:hypothetical protein
LELKCNENRGSIHGLYGVAFLGATGVVGTIIDAACVLADAMGIDPEKANIGVAHVVDRAVEDTFSDL